MSERFMVDDCGTLIDLDTRDTYDYVEDLVSVLNAQHEEIQQLRASNGEMEDYCARLEEQLKNLRRLANEMYMEGSE